MIGIKIGAAANLPNGALQARSASATGSPGERTHNSPAPLHADAATRQASKTDGPRARTEEGSSRVADPKASPASLRTAEANNAHRRERGTTEGDRDADAPEDFASMLAASSPSDAIPPVPVPVPLRTVGATDQADDVAPPPTELPAQFLALLSGNPELHAAANDGPANSGLGAAEAPTTGALPTTITKVDVPATTPSLLPSTVVAAGTTSLTSMRAPSAPAAEPAVATAVATASADAKAPAILATLAASGVAAAVREAAKPGVDRAQPIDGPSADNALLAATTPVLAPVRAAMPALVPAAPLALPADPDAGFDDGFGSRIVWMTEQRLGHAQIRLNPEHVGPIEVRVQLDGDRVSAQFNSVHADVRQAIEASLPRLRDMLGQHGLQLGHADVGQGGAGRGEDQGSSQRGGSPNGSKDVMQPPPVTFGGTRRLLDEYA